MFRRFAEFVLILKWPLLLVISLVTAITGGAALRLQIDPSTETLFVKNTPEYKYYREYSDQYGSDQMIAVAVNTPEFFTLSNLKKLKKLTDEIGSYGQVERVLSLANAMNMKHKFMGLKVVPALEAYFEGKEEIEDLKQEILGSELFRNNLISADGKTAILLIHLKSSQKDRGSAGTFIDQLRKHLASYERPNLKFYQIPKNLSSSYHSHLLHE